MAQLHRFIVRLDGTACKLRHLEGLSKTAGILLPGQTADAFSLSRSAHFSTQEKASAAIHRTRRVSESLRTSLVSDFLRAKCPELAALFTDATFTVDPITIERATYKKKTRTA